MPDRTFDGETRFGLGTLLAGAPLGYAGAKVVRGTGSPLIRGLQTTMRPDLFSKVVSGKYRGYFQELESWVPPMAQTPDELNTMILESFKRRLGGGDIAIGITSMQEAVTAAEAAPGVKMLLRESFQEFAGMEAGMLGATMDSLLAGTPLTTEGGAALTNVGALKEFLSRGELGLGKTAQAGLATDLQALGELAGELLGAKPTFQYRVMGKDKAISELLINFYRKGGGVTQFTLPIPSEAGLMTRPNGSLTGVRKVLGNLEAVAASVTGGPKVAPIPITTPEYAIRRLRDVMARPDFHEAVPDIQEEIRRLIITAEAPEVAEAFASQMAVDPGRQAHAAMRIQAREALAVEGLAAGMPAGPLGKGIYYTPGAAPGGGAPPHYGQAMTKAYPTRGRMEAQLFQVSPAALEEAGIQLGAEFPGVGYELAVPRADQILMAREAEGRLGGAVTRRMTLDPTAPASKRFEKIMTMLQDNKTTKDMLTGGSTVEETLMVYARAAGPEEVRAMTEQLLVQEGEVLGFTMGGTAKVKTYGLDTLIKNFETVGGDTIVTTEGYYTPDKLFGPGGVKHSVEYADLSAVERIGVRGKALEIMRMRGEHTLEGAAYQKALARAEYQAQELFAGSLGLIVEGKDWKVWEKTGAGEKNFSRFNQMMVARLEEKTGPLPGEFLTVAPGKQEEYLRNLARQRGLEPETFFDPVFMARRTEELRLGKPPGLGGIGREATFTEDAFQIFKMAGWDDISESLLKRTRMDAPAAAALIQAGQAARQTAPGGITVEEMYRQGWMKPGGEVAGTIFDPRVRSQFIEETGGVIELPQEYRIQGMKVKRIAVPEFPSGHVGYYTTDEGRLIHKELDAGLRSVLEASVSDIGASATASADLAATEPLGRYFETLSSMAIAERDILGGKVTGSMKFAVGKEFIGQPTPILAPEVQARLGLTGEAARIPSMQIAPEKFEQTIQRAIREGVLEEDLAVEMRAMFREGRMPGVITKHPARGLGALPVYTGPHPEGGEMIGYRADSTFANLTENLHPLLTSDLDHDPLDADFLLTRESMAEARAALETGQVNQIVDEYARLEALVGDPKVERRAEGVFRIFEESGMFSPEYLAKRAERDALTKRNVGLFTSRVGWPAAVSAESGQFNFMDMFKMRFWRVSVEEAATHKIKHKLEVPADMVDQISEAWRGGKSKKVKSLTAQLFGITEEHMMQYEEEFGSVIERMVGQWENIGADNKQFVESVFAGKGRGGARHFLTLQDGIINSATTAGRFVRNITGEGSRVTSRVGRALGKTFQTLGTRKRAIGLALAATAGIAALTKRPRDLTPEAVTSGQVAGGSPRQSSISSPLPQLKKNLYYKKGARPGYRVFGRTGRVADHQELTRKAAQITGGMPTNVNLNDRRRMIHKDEIERAMMKDPILGSRQLESTFFNRSPLSL